MNTEEQERIALARGSSLPEVVTELLREWVDQARPDERNTLVERTERVLAKAYGEKTAEEAEETPEEVETSWEEVAEVLKEAREAITEAVKVLEKMARAAAVKALKEASDQEPEEPEPGG